MIRRGPELRLATYCILLYVIFITWGYLQEKITSTSYFVNNELVQWDYPIVLNLFMTISASVSAWMVEQTLGNKPNQVQFKSFWRSAMSAALASPIGYHSLKFIGYPMMVLTKSSKHVPVMIVGRLFYKQSYEWYKYFTVLMVCGGIAIFTVGKGSSKGIDSASTGDIDSTQILKLITGLFLIIINLGLDGITNNEQDKIFKTLNATSMQMMKYMNVWQALYLMLYLSIDCIIYGVSSNFICAFSMISHSVALAADLALFCVCGCVGQIIMFGLIKEFGSLVWITVSVTRQLLTILLSVFIFNHPIKLSQWIGIMLVFGGLAVEIYVSYSIGKNKAI